jgi:hypothetical protein
MQWHSLYGMAKISAQNVVLWRRGRPHAATAGPTVTALVVGMAVRGAE